MPFLLLNCTFPWTLWEWPMESMAIPSMQERHFLYPTEDPCHSLMISPGFLSYIIIWFSCYGIWNENHSWVKKRKQTFLVVNCFICIEIKEMITFPCSTKTESSTFFFGLFVSVSISISTFATGIYKDGETNAHFRSEFSRSKESLRDVLEKMIDRSLTSG